MIKPERVAALQKRWMFATAMVIGMLAPFAPAALRPDQIALVVNSNVPASQELARFYAEKRNIPAGHIIALDLPFPQEEMPFARYDAEVVPTVRKFLQNNGLKEKVTCIVTFWGVPLRVARRIPSPEEAKQLQTIDQEAQETQAALEAAVGQAEELARDAAVAFQPGQGRELAQLAKRAGDAMTAALRSISAMQEGDRRNGLFRRLTELLEQLSGEAELFARLSKPEFAGLAPEPVSTERLKQSLQKVTQWKQELQALQARPDTPQKFETMRQLARDHFGLFSYLGLLQAQKADLDPKETESAFDSELSLLWWDNRYPRNRWQPNVLNYKAAKTSPSTTPPTLMVMRLDGPTAETVDRIISSSLKIEKQGLQGQVVLDARGMRGPDGYGRYDQTIRNLADLLRAKTQLKLTLDDRDTLIQPGPAAPRGVALYCGWYSLRNYVPAFQFNEGAVGFHIASSELVSLRGENERGWVRGLLTDGVVATVGPVAEPYLHSFPHADEFFPLLMTGKLTLAEVYWKTNPLTSWMNTCIGDPLYTPYRVNPPLKVEDLPENLGSALEPAAAAAATPPASAPAATPTR